MPFETIFNNICNCNKKTILKTRTVNGTFSRHLKQFGNGVNILKTNWNCRANKENSDGKWCFLTIFETISNRRDHFETKMLSCALWHFLKTIFEIAMRKWVHVVTLSTGREKGRPQPGTFENKNSDWCILTDAIWKDILAIPEKKLKTRMVNDAISRYWIRCFDLQRKFCKAVKLIGAFWANFISQTKFHLSHLWRIVIKLF